MAGSPVSSIKPLLPYSEEQLARFVAATRLTTELRASAALVALDPSPADELRADGLLPEGVPSPSELLRQGREYVDELFASHADDLRTRLCPRWIAARDDEHLSDLAPIVFDAIATMLDAGEQSHIAAVAAYLIRYRLDTFCAPLLA